MNRLIQVKPLQGTFMILMKLSQKCLKLDD